MNSPLPHKLHAAFGNLDYVRQRGQYEWSSECPQCSDYGHVGNDSPDRFRMFIEPDGSRARGWCRICRHFQWADGKGQLDPHELERIKEERARLNKLAIERQQARIAQLQNEALWAGWHRAMNGNDARSLWHDAGIDDASIDQYQLGYANEMTFRGKDDEMFATPTLTIPHWRGSDVVNIQHRLLVPQSPSDKYRQTARLPSAEFRTQPSVNGGKDVLIVEGAKKAIVVHQHMTRGSESSVPYVVIGIPSKSPSRSLLESFSEFGQIFLALDPDAYVFSRNKNGDVIKPAVDRIGAALGSERVKLVRLACKPDDFFTMYGGSAGMLDRKINRAASTC